MHSACFCSTPKGNCCCNSDQMKRWLQTFSFLSLLFVSSPCPLPPCWFTPPLPIVLFCFERCRSRSLAAGPTPAAHTHCFDQRSSRKRTKRASSLPQGASLSMSLALPSHRCASLPVCNGGGWPWSRMHTHAHAPSLLHTFCLTQPPPPPKPWFWLGLLGTHARMCYRFPWMTLRT